MQVQSPGLGRSPGIENGTPLQQSYLENPMGRGAWQTIYSPWVCKESDMTEHKAYKMVLKIFAKIWGHRTPDMLQSQWTQATQPLTHCSSHSDTELHSSSETAQNASHQQMPRKLDKTQVPRKRSVFIPIPKKGNTNACSNYRTIALISQLLSKLCSKPSSQASAVFELRNSRCSAGFRKGREPEIKLPTSVGS